jgi:multidrug transporter EmrE-like cation transporter
MRTLAIAGLILTYMFFTVVSNVGFKRSAASSGTRDFLRWQAVGNVAGFLSVLALTGILRFIPLHLATAFTVGLGFVAIQFFGAHLVCGETITTSQWLGITLIAVGVVVVSLGGKGVAKGG